MFKLLKNMMPLLCYQVRTDLHIRYMGSLLGAYWSVANPVMQVGMYVFLFAFILNARLGGTSSPFDYALFCLAGLGAWTSFHEALTSCASSISRNAAIVKNVAFPTELFPTSAVLCSFVTTGTTYSALILLRAIDGHLPGASILALPLVIAAQALLALGLGFFLAIIGAFFRDIMQILPMLLQLLMLATPVVYQRADVPQSMQFLTDYNPLYYLIESYRRIFYYGDWPNWGGLAAVAVVGLLLTLSGWKLFRTARGYFEAVV